MTRDGAAEGDWELFVACAPGLERLLVEELRALGVEELKLDAGGVALRGDARLIHRANLELGLASHVLVRLVRFPVRALGELERKARRLPWDRWLRPGTPRSFRAACRRSRLYHGKAVCQRVAEGAARVLGDGLVEATAEQATEAVPVRIRVFRDRCTISIDASGDPLHRRGWRLESTKAPLREDLARALVLASGWESGTPLVDPMCGAGTIPIEAALIARDLAPGLGRRFALERTRLFEPELDQELRAAARDRSRPEAGSPIVAADRLEGAVGATRRNAERAGVLADLDVRQVEVDALEWPDAPRGAVVTDPPYGRRTRSKGIDRVYADLARRVGELPEAWKLALVVAERRLLRGLDLSVQPALTTDHGGLKVDYMVRP